MRLTARSSDYRTPPWGVKDQPPFVNLSIAVETSLPPRALLARAQAVERALGRERAKERRWGPRTIDIDLLAYDDIVLNEPDLTLPHPRLFERAFVLVPLAEIAAERRSPAGACATRWPGSMRAASKGCRRASACRIAQAFASASARHRSADERRLAADASRAATLFIPG